MLVDERTNNLGVAEQHKALVLISVGAREDAVA
jgi:hypothetical protein